MEIQRAPEDVAKAEKEPLRQAPRLLWMLTEGLTQAIIHEEARKLGLIADVKLGDRTLTLSRKLLDMPGDTCLALRAACYARIGITDPEAFERKRMAMLPAFKRWQSLRGFA